MWPPPFYCTSPTSNRSPGVHSKPCNARLYAFLRFLPPRSCTNELERGKQTKRRQKTETKQEEEETEIERENNEKLFFFKKKTVKILSLKKLSFVDGHNRWALLLRRLVRFTKRNLNPH